METDKMTGTPETDQKAVPHIGFYSCATVPAEFARKLERERDEALSQIVQAECRAERFCQERDEARLLLIAAQSALDAIHLEVGGWIKTMKENVVK